MDCTGSMACHIDAAKNCILNVAKYMEDMKPSIKIRVGFCGYRDYCDGADRLLIFPFTDSCMNLENDLSTVLAMGGGDIPEDVLGGLDAAVNQMTWQNKIRVLFHVGDAPPHGRRFTSMTEDYPEGDPNHLTAENVLEKMQSENIFYFFGKINNLTEKMVNIFHSIIGDFSVFDLEIVEGNPEALISKFFEATCSAINTAVSLRE
ncbi:17860_t:CDS:1 [Funneliformis caledonium]|uniref:17860_t:CDS:1 n=1 Tax=Funneliformis caledonium TaxID=1117310 RepID=A0A9N9A6Z6_9GLOM|nr:17860_t:CDS:1 [Funneliformis caledonium]